MMLNKTCNPRDMYRGFQLVNIALPFPLSSSGESQTAFRAFGIRIGPLKLYFPILDNHSEPLDSR